MTGGPFNGIWTKAADKWVFEWPLVDSLSVAENGNSLSTKNAIGAATASRDASCKGR